MDIPQVRSAEDTDKQQLLATILLGFSMDPFVRFFWPKAGDYLNCTQAFDAFGGGAIANGTAYVTDNFEGVALWFPPGSGPDEERFVAILEATARQEVLEDGFRVFESMGEYHPDEPCWYLPLIAVDPAHQGRGFGAQLMKHALDRCDSEGLPAYLESTNPRNISLYQRHGFQVMGEIKFGASPVVTPMIRPANA